MSRVNIGCGTNPLAGWINVDITAGRGVDVVFDLEQCRTSRLPLADDSAEEFLLSHVIEHVRDTLALMQELHRVAKNGAIMVLRCPHGANDDAWEDPTHTRAYFPGSLQYFSQLAYRRADYGYRGDWELRRLTLRVRAEAHQRLSQAEILERIHHGRNAVAEMVAELVAVKPPRQPAAGPPPGYETVIDLF